MNQLQEKQQEEEDVTIEGLDPKIIKEWPRLARLKIKHPFCCCCIGVLLNCCKPQVQPEPIVMSISRYKPTSLTKLSQRTNFTRDELKLMYRGFKNECPTGIVHKETFRDIFNQFFPLGDASLYADLVFNSFDTPRNGFLTFETVIEGMSLISKGSVEEKLNWAFNLYDIDQNGYITADEVLQIVTAIYEMLGHNVHPHVSLSDRRRHADRVFHRLDCDQDGRISKEDFVMACKDSRDVEKELDCFLTLL